MLKQYCRQQYPSSRGIFDYFRPFVELSVRLLSSGGAVGMVLPDIVLLKDYVATRRYLLETLTLRRIDCWGMAFSDAVIDSATIIGTKNTAAPDHKVRIGIHAPESERCQFIPQADFASNPRCMFNLFLTPAKRQVLHKLERSPKLGEFFEVHEGVHSGNIRAELFVYRKVNASCRELYFGRDEIARYQLHWSGRYIRLDALPQSHSGSRYANLGQAEWHERKKLLVRRTGDRVLAAVDEHGRYASNNFFLVFVKQASPLDLYGLAALLNSRLLTAYFRTIEPRQGRAFAELKIKHLSVFPLPLTPANLKGCAKLNDLGRKRTVLAKDTRSASSYHAARRSREIVALDSRIENSVRRLFQISDPCPLDTKESSS